MIDIERNQVEGVLDNVRVSGQRPNILTETYQTKEETENHTQSREPTIYFPQKFNPEQHLHFKWNFGKFHVM